MHFALLVSSGDKIEPAHLKVTGGWNTGANHQQVPQPVHQQTYATNNHQGFGNNGFNPQTGSVNGFGNHFGNDGNSFNNNSGNGDDPMTAIAKQLRRLFNEQGDSDHFDKLESLIVHEAFAHVRSNQVHGAALLGISRNVMRTLLKRHGLLADNGFNRAEDPTEQESDGRNLVAGFAG